MPHRSARAPLLAGLAALALGACGADPPPRRAAATIQARGGGRDADPLAGRTLYVDPENPAALQARRLRDQGEVHDAELIERIASQPTATWFASGSAAVQSQASALAAAAGAQGKLPVIVAYDIPQRDCAAGYSAGGAATPAEYLAWIARLAAGIGTRGAIVILEPDALPDALSGCLSAGAARARLALLRRAVAILERGPSVIVYIDAGNSNWIKPPRRLVAPLRAAGVAEANGFALNVANFRSTAASVAYGEKLSRLLGGAHFVIDTSRNGNGPDTNPADAPDWCNPPGRALGHAPTTSTGSPLVDAYLWVKRPGESDGSCRPGAPPAGSFWLQYALALAAASG